MPPLITLTTDFGLCDSYVGIMKGVLLSICPAAHLVDITHLITPQDVIQAAMIVQSSAPYFPPNTVHLVVVDPGVGTTRQPIALSLPHARYVGPNNGIFGLLWQQTHAQAPTASGEAVVLTEPRFWRPSISATFHGRDIFAPVAAWLANGVALAELGPPLDQLILPAVPQPTWHGTASLHGQVLTLDHFGNCITNITATDLQPFGTPQSLTITVGEHPLPLATTYADVAIGAPLALIGSNGYLEIAIRNGAASTRLGIERGTPIAVAHASSSVVE